ncbi:16S rRNA (cytosine(967)-C(5))-methyltransferase RsmB [Alkalibaculum sp. M08DMB]|uniref:16S rRNA (cytosine(967)-C(5))-methyltransferase n=1 Tax=Alkalibaculum sporogenes TaxID=2655001 RepID=A0A6A7KAG7_9FIRM|nr:16S rRNA (cytosine(967)-C(5))-methyltransferase RsmB [Alkalibaculum sporogenes]MPW26033.1 16S rRNA (cytosine(967)-C(5))-methyltransferase RsmB [Alkalibaculum sporogenes]
MQNKIDYPREVAIKLLYEINTNDAFINIVLKKSLKNSLLKDVDRSFINALVNGVIKNRNYCDWIITNHSKTKFEKISPWIKEILRLSVFQIFFLDKVPDSAAVNESVKLSKKYSKGKADKFVNGVLRNIIRNKDEIINKNFTQHEELIIKYSAPVWIAELLKNQYKLSTVKSFFIESLNSAPTTIRVNKLKINKNDLIKILEEEDIDVYDAKLCESAIVIKNFGDITKYNSYKDGLFIIQDEAAMLVVDVLDPKPGDIVLDMCSAPGGKTTHIGEKILDQPGLSARDIYQHKLELINENCNRLHLENVKLELKNGSVLYSEDIEKYDKILLDAPCSGLGIIRRKPDIKWKLKKQDINSIIKLQKQLIDNAFTYLKPGGVLVYSTCTINKMENQEIVEYLMNKYKNAVLLDIENVNKDILLNDKFIQTFPELDGCDGFFISKILKASKDIHGKS